MEDPKDLVLHIDGTADASTIAAGSVTMDMQETEGTWPTEDAYYVSGTGSIVLTDLDDDDSHTLDFGTDAVSGGEIVLSLAQNEEAVVYVLVTRDEDGNLSYSYSTDATARDSDSCYGYLTITGGEDDTSYSYTFTVAHEKQAIIDLLKGESLTLNLPFTVTDTSPYSTPSGDDPVYEDGTTEYITHTDGTLAVTIVGRNEPPLFENKTYTVEISEDGRTVTTADGSTYVSYAVTGSVDVSDEDPSSVTLKGWAVQSEDEAVSGSGSTVVYGTYGTLILGENGTYTYRVNYEDVQHLAAGESTTDSFRVAVTDRYGATSAETALITVTINGANDMSVLAVTRTLEVTEQAITEDEQETQAAPSATGTLTVTDMDYTDKHDLGFQLADGGSLVDSAVVAGWWVGDTFSTAVYATQEEALAAMKELLGEDAKLGTDYGILGTLEMETTLDDQTSVNASGTYTFTIVTDETGIARTLDAGQTVTQTVNVAVSDYSNSDGSLLSTSTSEVVVTVNGTNQGPTVIMSEEATFTNEKDALAALNESNQLVVEVSDKPGDTFVVIDPDHADQEPGALKYWLVGETASTFFSQIGNFTIDNTTGTVTYTLTEAQMAMLPTLGACDDEKMTFVTRVAVVDSYGNTTIQSFRILIKGENDEAEIGSGGVNVENNLNPADSSASASATGKFTFTDADVRDTHKAYAETITIGGKECTVSQETGYITYNGNVVGKLAFTTTNNAISDSSTVASGTGSFLLTLNANGKALFVDSLSEGQTATVSMQIMMHETSKTNDDSTAVVTDTEFTTVEFDVTGTNDAASIDLSENDSTDAASSHTYVISDADTNDTHTVALAAGSVTVDAGDSGLSITTAAVASDGTVTATVNGSTVTLGQLSAGSVGSDGSVTVSFTAADDYAGTGLSLSGVQVLVTESYNGETVGEQTLTLDGTFSAEAEASLSTASVFAASTLMTSSVSTASLASVSLASSSIKATLPSQASISLSSLGTALTAAMLALLVVPNLPGTDSDGTSLSYALAADSDLVSMSGDGTLALTDAGITALADAAAQGQALTLSLSYTASDGETSETQTLDLTLETDGVQVIASSTEAWAFGTGEAEVLTASEVIGTANAAEAEALSEEAEETVEDLLSSDAPVTLYGGAGNDFLAGGTGADSLYGGEGNDILVWDEHDVVIDGGAGIDMLISADASSMPNLAQLLDGVAGEPEVTSIEFLLTGKGLENAASREDVVELLKENNATVNEDGTITVGEGWTKTGTHEGANETMTEVWQHGEGDSTLTLEAVVSQPSADSSVDAAVLVLSTTSV